MLIIGIAGGSGSGKSTFVKRIMENVESDEYSIMPQDNYYKDHSHLPMDVRVQQNFDHPNAIAFNLLIEQVKLLKQGRAIEMPTYSHITCTRNKETIPIKPCKILIIEGIMVLAKDDLVDLLDMKFFVDADNDDRFIRCVKRDIEERGRTFESVVSRYYETVKPMYNQFIEPSKQKADLIIPHGGENKVAIDLISSKIRLELIENKTTI